MYKGIERLKKYDSQEDIKTDLLKPYKDIINSMKRVYIFGAKGLGKNVKKYCIKQGIEVKGFIDNDKSIHGRIIDGIPVYGLEEIKEKILNTVIIISTLNYWSEIEIQLIENGIRNYIAYPVLSIFNEDKYPIANNCFKDIVQDIYVNKNKYLELFDKFEDEVSKKVFDNVLLYRLTMDINYLRIARDFSNGQEQYFENRIVYLDDNEVFVDAGGYLGETTLSFINKVHGNFKKVYFFEPDRKLIKQAKENLKHKENIVFVEAGTGSDNCIKKFDNTGDTGGSVTKEGVIEVQIQKIDNIVNDKITFIKMDVEGYEEESISGAVNTIMFSKPKMAISAYHYPKDLWNLHEVVYSMRDDYKIYIRHYTSNCFETDLYFV